jgi:3-oxoadipate enol-lactonase
VTPVETLPGGPYSLSAVSYSVHGPVVGGPPRHTFVLAHALGCDRSMWDGFIESLSTHSRVICYDQLGHGRSDAPEGPYDMAGLSDLAALLIEELTDEPVIWLGLSMGGMVGQELALRHPQLVKALILANTTSGYPPDAQQGWALRIENIRKGGMEAIVDGALQRWFHDGFRRAHPEVVAHWRQRVVDTDVAGYLGACEAIAKVDTTSRLHAIRVPVLVIAGELDQGTPPSMASTIAQAIDKSTLVVLPEASHLSVLEQPRKFESTVNDWLGHLS